MRKLLYISLFLTLVCNLLPDFIDLSQPVRCNDEGYCSTIGDEMFFAGIWSFIMAILYIVKSDIRFNKDRHFISFFIGLSFWALIKPLFSDPSETHWTEYAYLFSGLLFLITQYVYNNYSKRFKKRG